MTRMRRRSSAVLALTLGLASLGGSAGASSPSLRSVTCTSVIAVPAPSTTVYCAGLAFAKDFGAPGPVNFFVSRDRGSTWTRQQAVGVTGQSFPATSELALSPQFQVDRRVYWGTGAGLQVSSDDGNTFTTADPQASFARHAVLPLVMASPLFPAPAPPATVPDPGGLLRPDVGVLLPGGSQSSSQLFVAPVERPIAATTSFNYQFLVPPDGSPVIAVAWENDSSAPASPRHLALYQCDRTFACPSRLSTFAFAKTGTTFPELAWISPGYRNDRTMAFVTFDASRRRTFWRSTDGGKTVQPWSTINQIVRSIGDVDSLTYAFSASPNRPRAIYLRLANTSREQIWMSSDGGSRWTRQAWGETQLTGGKVVGTLPWEPGSASIGSQRISIQKDRLLTTATKADASTLWCSRDWGRTWRDHC